ncbi:hypothetical protein NRIC_01980 [Enterococcus florum]|uniref:Uncharacterized protein n=1 Tax=Enterococcus florum TaxID=2480627 RepID=A0A4P5P3J6_9ENTE|nr:DUF6681 family protein [Enterococcus florum]GCF92307.1 hypothetical protein NRIC_01980 [Enterococcus florum]
MTFILEIINGLNKFLGFLEISPKYLNRGYTLLGLLPTFYIMRIIYGLWLNHNYFQMILYTVVFLLFLYFFVLNFFYYFLDKNLKIDITQLFVKYLPDEAFNIQQENKKKKQEFDSAEEIAIDFIEDYQLIVAENIQWLVEKGELRTNDLSESEGFLIDKDTLYPYYYLKMVREGHYIVQIGHSYQTLSTIGEVYSSETLKPIGLFIIGGDFVRSGVRYHEPYQLKLLVRSKTTKQLVSRSSRHN